MGFNISFLATTAPIERLLPAYRLQEAPKADGPLPEKGPWIATLTNGWTIWRVDTPGAFTLDGINPHVAAGISKAAVFAVSIAEFNMNSSITRYLATAKSWEVAHKGDGTDKTNIKTTGKLPHAVTAQRDAVLAEQSQAKHDVNIVFDLPSRIGEAIFAFRYDRVTPETDFVRWVRPVPIEPKLGLVGRILGLVK